MLDRIGFDRFIKIGWLNKTAEIFEQEKKPQNIREALDHYLKDEVGGDNRRKTINILMRTWINVGPEHVNTRDKALELFKSADENEKIGVHWIMFMLAYPVFDNFTAAIGKLFELQDEFVLGTVKRRMYELWGERTTLQYAVEKMARSLANWEVVESSGKPGNYKRRQPIEIKNMDIKLLLVEAYLLASGKLYIQFMKINSLNEFFPFIMDIDLADFQTSEIFKLDKMGGEPVIGLRN